MTPSNLPREELLIQIIEECGELVQAASKMIRYEHGMNPTLKEYWMLENNLVEEIADVQLSIDTFLERRSTLPMKVDAVRKAKENRWYDRLNAGGAE